MSGARSTAHLPCSWFDEHVRYADLPSGRLAYWLHGNADAAAVLLIHGLGNSSEMWTAVMPVLSDLRVIAIDIPGFGRSTWEPTGLDARMVGREVWDCLRSELGFKRTFVVGHSLGGLLAADMAAHDDGVCAGLIMLSSPPLSVSAALGLDRFELSAVLPLLLAAALGIIAFVPGLSSVVRWSLRYSLPRRIALGSLVAHPEHLDPEVAQVALGSFGGGRVASAFANARGYDYDAVYQSVGVPVRCIRGANDRLVIPTDISRFLTMVAGQADSVEIEDVGHMTPVEAPTQVGQAIAEFVSLHNHRPP